MTGETIGTPTYMAPEQALGAGPVGPRADLYGLGCVLFELITGQPPYESDTPLGVLHQHLDTPVPYPGAFRDDVPKELDELVFALLAKDPQDRPESAGEVYVSLLRWVTAELPPMARAPQERSSPDPTSPYRFPFGPLPRDSVAGTRLVAAQEAPASIPSIDEVREARDRAMGLIEDERFGQAADALATMLRRAAPIYGSGSPEILEARLDYGAALMLAGDFRAALPMFEQLGVDLARRYGSDHELVRECRQQVAICQAELGEATEALRTLRTLLAEVTGAAGFPMRQQIAVITASLGRIGEAGGGLDDLLSDMRRTPGVGPADIQDVEALRDHLRHLMDGTDH
ncbi:tetratricopeptide repeat-containing protein kinase family protein [Actinoplanes sp. NBRC 103695]|uniref:serine/threonine-protein kinase n=1 Tax=Actinoplanes sp. NBRC 103695 TaxID=3032202 RepID=UPI0024A16224|nr:tetratricopeptide repeat-containing protein kinase family protein [Actinoplanes sp. NBRC 103695]GLZ00250.1 hypothetical protein Acsp02_75020 [Actinoplanes sp. NBRC 103695]